MQEWPLTLHLTFIFTCVMLSLVCTISCLIAVIKKSKCVPFFFSLKSSICFQKQVYRRSIGSRQVFLPKKFCSSNPVCLAEVSHLKFFIHCSDCSSFNKIHIQTKNNFSIISYFFFSR